MRQGDKFQINTFYMRLNKMVCNLVSIYFYSPQIGIH